MSVEAAPPGPPRIELRLPATHRFTRLGRRVVERLAERQGYEPRRVEELSLIASELLSNCVDHAQPSSELLWMQLGVVFGPTGWELEVVDQGGGDAQRLNAALAEPLEPALEELDLDQERGRGLLLLRSLVDHLEASPSADGRGLRLFASKRWS
jgi:anti-sigma regulatory factor (Ser/Thr protein kinase)